MKLISYVVWVIVVVFGVIFATLNAYTVKLDYFAGVSHISLPFLLLLVLCVGVVVGVVSILGHFVKLRHANRRMRQRIHKMEQELSQQRLLNQSDQ